MDTHALLYQPLHREAHATKVWYAKSRILTGITLNISRVGSHGTHVSLWVRYCYPQCVRLLAGVYCGQNRVTCYIINDYTLRGLKAPSGNVSVVVPASWSCCAYLRVATSVFISCCVQPGPLTSQHYPQCRDIFRNSFLFYLTMIYHLSLKERMITRGLEL